MVPEAQQARRSEGASVSAAGVAATLALTLVAFGLWAALGVLVRGSWKAHRARWARERLSFCRSCGEPIQDHFCQNCTPLGLDAPPIGGFRAARWDRRWPSPASPDTLEQLLGETVEET
jgi:hypothetical protein